MTASVQTPARRNHLLRGFGMNQDVIRIARVMRIIGGGFRIDHCCSIMPFGPMQSA